MTTSDGGSQQPPKKNGYRNPPVEHRWKKGCPSPNPGGRPPTRKRELAVAAVDKVAEMVERVGSIQTGGDDPIELREMAFRKAYDIALGKEDLGAGANRPKVTTADRLAAIKLIGELERESARVLSEARQEQFNAAMDYKARWTEKFHAAEKAGRALPDTLPHPDDMIIDPHNGRVSIVGPVTPSDQIKLDNVLALRTVICESLDYFASSPLTPDDKKKSSKYRKMLRQINQVVPPRLYQEVPPPLR